MLKKCISYKDSSKGKIKKIYLHRQKDGSCFITTPQSSYKFNVLNLKELLLAIDFKDSVFVLKLGNKNDIQKIKLFYPQWDE
ncbi:MAG: hypothetical protein HUJ68_06770 [Clostridia bacterium]|nr:hypothetical protein [Clostridia bacterium]